MKIYLKLMLVEKLSNLHKKLSSLNSKHTLNSAPLCILWTTSPGAFPAAQSR